MSLRKLKANRGAKESGLAKQRHAQLVPKPAMQRSLLLMTAIARFLVHKKEERL